MKDRQLYAILPLKELEELLDQSARLGYVGGRFGDLPTFTMYDWHDKLSAYPEELEELNGS